MLGKLKSALNYFRVKVQSIFGSETKPQPTEEPTTPVEVISEEPVELTYRDNGDHIWDRDDTIISQYFYRLKNSKSLATTSVASRLNLHYTSIEKETKTKFGLTIKELANEVIGCTIIALDINSMVTEHFFDGVDTGRYHGNQHQIEMGDEYACKTIEELEVLVSSIINRIKNDAVRLQHNAEAKELRYLIGELKEEDRIYKKKEKEKKKRKKAELERDLKKAKVKKAVSVSNLESVEISEGSKIKHPTYGVGEVYISDEKKSLINFDSGLSKEFGNQYVAKFIIEDGK